MYKRAWCYRFLLSKPKRDTKGIFDRISDKTFSLESIQYRTVFILLEWYILFSIIKYKTQQRINIVIDTP